MPRWPKQDPGSLTGEDAQPAPPTGGTGVMPPDAQAPAAAGTTAWPEVIETRVDAPAETKEAPLRLSDLLAEAGRAATADGRHGDAAAFSALGTVVGELRRAIGPAALAAGDQLGVALEHLATSL